MDELRRALEAYKDDPVNVNDKPSSWRALDDLIDACDAALAARSEPRYTAEVAAQIAESYARSEPGAEGLPCRASRDDFDVCATHGGHIGPARDKCDRAALAARSEPGAEGLTPDQRLMVEGFTGISAATPAADSPPSTWRLPRHG